MLNPQMFLYFYNDNLNFEAEKPLWNSCMNIVATDFL